MHPTTATQTLANRQFSLPETRAEGRKRKKRPHTLTHPHIHPHTHPHTHNVQCSRRFCPGSIPVTAPDCPLIGSVTKSVINTRWLSPLPRSLSLANFYWTSSTFLLDCCFLVRCDSCYSKINIKPSTGQLFHSHTVDASFGYLVRPFHRFTFVYIHKLQSAKQPQTNKQLAKELLLWCSYKLLWVGHKFTHQRFLAPRL